MRSLLVFLSAFVLANPALSDSLARLEINFYGEFVHTEKLPKTLFMFDKIEAMHSFHLRKALREHEIETVVLSSDGGQVFEALQMSAIMDDNNLNTYIPEQGYMQGLVRQHAHICFSQIRIADGELGVHQFKSTEPGQALRGDDLEQVRSSFKMLTLTITTFLILFYQNVCKGKCIISRDRKKRNERNLIYCLLQT